ncbi:GNAT family N-acetyltransferase [Vibrio ulleungensis]|uniref:GNAT family N-acetyltransferase n=1 Tax=Vibrio ulleungensis TaxID=2807619 RepID=A0ABS2HBQ9_9VIBR|nr:GNAT family N-acetyltransferase [Vibrio ulleungensis]MBM7035030.1 GNAT family N-acetyltransferase [Vibrio ulleungensis]
MDIESINRRPIGLEELVRESELEGFRFLTRLSNELDSNGKAFDQQGETLMVVRDADRLIAIGGISNYDGVARLRRFYVKKAYRKSGVGTLLLQNLEMFASQYFSRITLFTDTASASKFYEARGYTPAAESRVSHQKIIK